MDRKTCDWNLTLVSTNCKLKMFVATERQLYFSYTLHQKKAV
jgi:hypothetical protein